MNLADARVNPSYRAVDRKHDMGDRGAIAQDAARLDFGLDDAGPESRKNQPGSSPRLAGKCQLLNYSIRARLASRFSDGNRLKPDRAKRCRRPTANAVSTEA